jgi:apolipoprotein N-acyltransferase
MGVYGAMRLAGEPTPLRRGRPKLRLMQPNLPQDAKFNYSAGAMVMRKYLSLSDRATGPQSGGVRDARS